jgi:translation elongation factor EF-Ts
MEEFIKTIATSVECRRTFAYDLDDTARANDSCLQEPGQTQANKNVEHIATDGVGCSHVTVSYLNRNSLIDAHL